MSILIQYAEPIPLSADAPLTIELHGHREGLTFGQLCERFGLEPNSDLRFAIAFRQHGRMILCGADEIMTVYPR